MKPRFQAEQATGPWWIVSSLLHAAAFAALVFFFSKDALAPRSAERSSALSAASPEKIRQVAGDIRERETESLRTSVNELLRRKEEMDSIQKDAFERLDEFQKMNPGEAEKRLAEAQARALKAEEESARKLAENNPAAAREKQELAGLAQKDALRELEQLPKPENAEALAAQKEAVKLQQVANAARDVALQVSMEAERNAARLAEIEKQISEALEAEKTARAASEAVTAQEATLRDKEIPAAEKSAAEAAQAIVSAPDEAAKSAAKNRDIESGQKVAWLRKTLEERQRSISRAGQDLTAAGERVRQLNADSQAVRSAAGKSDAKILKAAMEKSASAQAAALDSQQLAAGKASSIRTATAAPHPAPAKSEIDSAGAIPEIYETARRAEAALTATYQDTRAAELAALQHLPIREARALTQTTRPVRPDLDKDALAGPVNDSAGLQKQEAQILVARKEIGGMLALANDIISQSRPASGDGGTKVSSSSLKERSSHEQEMESAALANEGTRARDLTSLMSKSGNSPGGNPGAAGPQAHPSPVPRAATAMPPRLPDREFKAVPGRRLTSGPAQVEKGRNADWMFLDSWYLIGPWPNENRRNLNTKFPPESIINLDATYLTESGKKLSWQFFQSGSEQIVPPRLGEYQIGYAYTELWAEAECDRWISIGSDDQSKIWVNGELVWKSSDILKGWNPREGLRKIHLSKGNNRILLRLENGWRGCGFSIIVKVGE